MPDEPKPLLAIEVPLSRLNCPLCSSEFSWEIDPRTGIQDRTVLICQNRACKISGERWRAPHVAMHRLPAKP